MARFWSCVIIATLSVAKGALRGEDQDVKSCDLAVVGAGMGGAYAAWRASQAGMSVCVFEMNNRAGGRIHSLRKRGPQKDLVVEAGAYRFTAAQVCQWGGCFDTPLIRAAVEELGLKAAVYDPDPHQWDHKMRKIVDKDGNDAGYLTIPETLLDKATELGATVHYSSKVVGLSGAGEPREGGSSYPLVLLEIADGRKVLAKAVLLNIPQGPALELLRHSGAPFDAEDPDVLYDPTTEDLMKLYIHYDDAWWINDLGLKSGRFQNENPDYEGYLLQSPAPLSGQYHDGNVKCDLPGGRCRGFLQTYYAGEAIEYYKPYHNIVGEAAVELTPDTKEHKRLLERIHLALVEYHRKALDAVNATDRVSKMRPNAGVLSIWRDSVDGINAGCHNPKQGDDPLPSKLTDTALQPFPDMPLFIADEAFGPLSCWAEGSLNMSHKVIDRLGIPQPRLPEAQALDLSLPALPTDPFLVSTERRFAKLRAKFAGSEVLI